MWHKSGDPVTNTVELYQINLAGVAMVASSASADASGIDSPLPATQSAQQTAVDTTMQPFDQQNDYSLNGEPGPSITHPILGDYADLSSQPYVGGGGYPVLIWTAKGYVYELEGVTPYANGDNLLRLAQEVMPDLPVK